jgi:hypothetical protein
MMQVTQGHGCDFLLFVEDPGAANFVVELPPILRRHGYAVHLATAGMATDYLAQRALAVDPLPAGSDLEALVARLGPRLVSVGTAENPDSAGLRLVAIAAARGLPSVGMIDASTHLEHRFRGRSADPLEFCPNTVIVPDVVSRDGLVKLGLPADRIVVAGHPHWDHVRAEARRLQNEDRARLRQKWFDAAMPERRVLVFAAEVSGGMDPLRFRRTSEYSLTGDRGSFGRTEIVIEEFLHAIAPMREKVYLVLRLHPKNLLEDFAPYAPMFDRVSKAGSSLELSFAADAVIGMTSMMMIEAALLDRPTLSILPRAEEAEWLPTAACGLTPCATTRAEVAAELERLVRSRRGCDPVELERRFPSGASERVAAQLETLLLP